MIQIASKQDAPKLDIPPRKEIIRSVKERGHLLAGVLPIHYPRELLRAFNVHPIEIWGPPRIDPTVGAAHLQPYVCSIVRNALAFQQSGGLDLTDLILVPHACDSLQGLGSVLLDFIQPKQPIIPLYLPRTSDKAGLDFLAAELKKLYLHLKVITGKTPSEDDLLSAIQKEESYDHAFSELYRMRARSALSNYDFYRLVRSREFLPGESFIELVQSVRALEQSDASADIPIVISGILPEPMEMLESIERLGGRISDDDFASCGRRRYLQGTAEEPFERMAERLLSGPPDWNKGDPIQARLRHLLDMVETCGARGIVFYIVKFCEPELFDLPQLKDGLHAQGIPSLIVEMDINDSLSNQTMTRFQAFMEMIS
jgi:benzoyl-CoA reductase/2-hydroxyglutaryl-CoA dehydratase subunit BcrC/BadD/HgdB